MCERFQRIPRSSWSQQMKINLGYWQVSIWSYSTHSLTQKVSSLSIAAPNGIMLSYSGNEICMFRRLFAFSLASTVNQDRDSQRGSHVHWLFLWPLETLNSAAVSVALDTMMISTCVCVSFFHQTGMFVLIAVWMLTFEVQYRKRSVGWCQE